MRFIKRGLDYGGDIPYYTFYIMSDLHCGALIDMEQLSMDIEEIRRTENAVTWLNGDILDCINIKDRRFDPRTVAPWVKLNDPIGSQIDYAVALLEPIKDKIWGTTEGNHEYEASVKWERDIVGTLCRALGIENYTDLALIKLMFRRGSDSNRGGTKSLNLYLHHGNGGSTTNDQNTLRQPILKLQEYGNVRVAAMGHTHTLLSTRLDKDWIGENKIEKKSCLAARTGGYMLNQVEGVSTYASRRAYKNNRRGCFRFYYAPGRDILTTDLGEILR